MLISHKRKVAKKLSKWHPFFIEKFMGEILTHNLNKPFPKEITRELAYGGSISIKKVFSSWKSNIDDDTSVIRLKSTYPNVSDYLCAQIHLLNILCRNYGLKHLGYKKPFLQLYTGSVQDKIISNTRDQNTYSKGNCEPFRLPALKGYNKSHILLFSYSSINPLKKNKQRLINDTKKLFDQNEELSVTDAANQAVDQFYENIRVKRQNKQGKITGFWLISKTIDEIERYICITPHSNKTFDDNCIKLVIDTSERFSN